MTIFPLKIDLKCLGSLPIVSLTCTGSPPYCWSKCTAWNAEAATSSWVAWRPLNSQVLKFTQLQWLRGTMGGTKPGGQDETMATQGSDSPAICRVSNASCCGPSRCTRLGNSLLRRNIQTIQDPQGRAPDLQPATPEHTHAQRLTLQVS